MVPGGLISILILLPNLFWMLFPPREGPDGESIEDEGRLRWLWEVLEWAGRIAALVIPFFYSFEVVEAVQFLALGVILVALLFYYAGWARFFSQGRRYALLFEPLMGVPLPMAVSPIVALAAASVLLASWPLALATMVLGTAHLTISFQDYQSLTERI